MPVFKKEICSAVLFEEAVCIRKRYRFSESHSRCSESGTGRFTTRVGGRTKDMGDESKSDERVCYKAVWTQRRGRMSVRLSSVQPIPTQHANRKSASAESPHSKFALSVRRHAILPFRVVSRRDDAVFARLRSECVFRFLAFSLVAVLVLHCSGVTQPLLTVTIVTLR